MAFDLIAFDIFFVLSIIALVSAWKRIRATMACRGLPLPPGPPGLPIVGNLFDLPTSNEWVVYRDWGTMYNSSLVCVSTYGLHTVIVNSARAAHELFERRSGLYSDRPAMTAIRLIGVDTWNLGILRYGSAWRVQRKMFHEHFRPEVLAKYEPHQAKAVHAFLRMMVTISGSTTDMDHFRTTIRHLTGTIIMRIAYGVEIQGEDTPYLLMLEKAVAAMNEATKFSGIILDLFPFLQKMPSWFPGAGFKSYAKTMRPEVGEAVKNKPWDDFIADIETEHGQDGHTSIAGQLLKKHGDDPALLDAAKATVGVMYVAGADTTVSALSSFFMAMILYPNAQRKAQKELDDVLRGMLPTLANYNDLPYITALVKEVFRWHPVTALGVAHALTMDDVYENMFIPAGTTVIGNVWAILHDPVLFPDPETFNPAHFISTDDGGAYPAEECTKGEPPFPEAAFGFGRRICLGRLLAKKSVWLTVASVLSMFDISPAKDENGADIPVVETWESGIVGFPGPYKCVIKPRSQKALETVMATAADAPGK